jgi:pimeloyl-ACP methyl ester carboxylesterase
MSHLPALFCAMTMMICQITHAAEPWKADASLAAKLSAARSDVIYDEDRVPEYSLPDPLRLNDGTHVTNASQWPSRRIETMDLFRTHVYGRRPAMNETISFTLQEERSGLFGIDARARNVQVTVTVGDAKFEFPCFVFLPAKEVSKTESQSKLPAIVFINNREFPTFDNACTETDGFYPVKEILQRGYATCQISTSLIDPDRPDGYQEGIRGFIAKQTGAPETDDSWKALSAWGWGASRALDYLLTVDEIDAKRIGVIGHSRGGKTALWAAAEDERFAIACSNNSGCGGAALSRRGYGETVARITTNFPHWFCDRFATYSGKESQLPVDQHQLFALIAPRGVYVTSASDDLWADPRGEYLSLVASAPVYRLLGGQAIEDAAMPAVSEPKVTASMGYHIRPGEHDLKLYDWMKFIDFCDQSWQ